MKKIAIKRVYDPPAAADGTHVLVDRLWPRGLRKESAASDLWPKEITPSDELRNQTAINVHREHYVIFTDAAIKNLPTEIRGKHRE